MLSCRGALGVAALAAALGIAAAPAGAYVPPGRTLELVTPTSNPSAKVDVLPFARIGSDGNEVAFQVLGDRDTGSSNVLNTYLSSRTANGWTVKRLSPPEAPDNVQPWQLYPNPYFMFNSNLTEALYDAQGASPIVPGEPSADNLYEQNTTTGASTLITSAPPFPAGGATIGSAPRVAWATPDLKNVIFDNDTGTGFGADYLGTKGGPASYLYDWTPSHGLSIASVWPFFDQALNTSLDYGAVGGSGALTSVAPGGPIYSQWYGGNPHAISDDGTRIFFEGVPYVGLLTDAGIYQRRDQGQPDASTHFVGGGEFIDATPDGHQALFSNCNKETPDATTVNSGAWACGTVDDSNADNPFCSGSDCAGRDPKNKNDLYLWNENGNGGAGSITDLTTEDPNGADVMGVLGASTDLSRIYFVARGNLTGTAPAPNDFCQTPAGQAPNLYVWDKTDGIKFIAQLQIPTSACFLNDGDMTVWQSNLDAEHKNSAVSPDGSVVAFATEASLDPTYDNVDADTGLPHKEVYFYRYGSSGPVCVSCVGYWAGDRRCDDRQPGPVDFGERDAELSGLAEAELVAR